MDLALNNLQKKPQPTNINFLNLRYPTLSQKL